MKRLKETAEIPQAKILRVFQLIGLLKTGGRTVSQLADQLDTTTRTMYRYFKLLGELGFVIDQDFHNKYFIHREEGENPEDRFSIEEVRRSLAEIRKRGHTDDEFLDLHRQANLMRALAPEFQAIPVPQSVRQADRQIQNAFYDNVDTLERIFSEMVACRRSNSSQLT